MIEKQEQFKMANPNSGKNATEESHVYDTEIQMLKIKVDVMSEKET